jgi:hypothetical protein
MLSIRHNYIFKSAEKSRFFNTQNDLFQEENFHCAEEYSKNGSKYGKTKYFFSKTFQDIF